MSYKVTLLRSNRSFTVYENETLLDAALAHGIALPYQCRDADCRTCRTRIISGSVTHTYSDDKVALTRIELDKGYRLICAAVAHSDVELDI